ncbi:MAG TPA: CvpA family protein [Candidatus Baltobacteraceae bacterium]|jgi:membrane protein required for colicin V production|nr:CvpA family protein [Candidatus Baltobacteraceae bacterium]
MVWPDLVIAAVLLIAALKGFKRGFVMELAGFIAIVLALIAPWFYNGAFDGIIEQALHLGPGSAHVLAMAGVGIATYAAVMIVARILSAIARLPILGIGNALAGAAVGILKGLALVWIVLYIALFFPLSRDIRADLHRSVLVGIATMPNGYVDHALSATLPSFARPLTDPVFERHRV